MTYKVELYAPIIGDGPTWMVIEYDGAIQDICVMHSEELESFKAAQLATIKSAVPDVHTVEGIALLEPCANECEEGTP